MNILFTSDVPCFFPVSGSEQVLYQQAIGLSRKDLNVFAITRINGDAESLTTRTIGTAKEACYSIPSKSAVRIMSSLFKKPQQLYRNFIKEGSFCVSVCHQPFTCISLLLSGKLTNIPMIYVFHSPSHQEYLLSDDNKTYWWKLIMAHIRKMIEGYCLKRAQKIIVLSKYMKRKAIQVHRISKDLIVVNPGGVDLDRFKPPQDRNRIKTELDYSVGKVHLLTVRNLEPRMGIDNLLKGFYLLKEKNIPVQLIIAGEGPEKEKIRKIVKEYGLITDVTLTGFVPPDKLAQYYGAADFFVLPTRDLEGFGLVTPESMACGTPVLGTPVGGTKEILEKFDPQFLFDDTTPQAMAHGIRKVIDEYLKEEDKYNQLRTQCREFVAQHYSWQRHIDTLESIIYQLVESGKIKN